jgi:hypothetical protein
VVKPVLFGEFENRTSEEATGGTREKTREKIRVKICFDQISPQAIYRRIYSSYNSAKRMIRLHL